MDVTADKSGFVTGFFYVDTFFKTHIYITLNSYNWKKCNQMKLQLLQICNNGNSQTKTAFVLLIAYVN